ncbi:MAG TPA: EAL domain-containing protein [Vicinamibacteria bacterium]|nr:EAL domain-containing protein [Vicinamibacteria bacterium]
MLHPRDRITMIEIRPLPFRVGRRPSLNLTLPTDSVSTEHAEFYVSGDGLRLRDLGSTNGTFVNRSRIKDSAVREGDVVHFADLQFEVVASAAPAQSRTAVFKGLPSPQSLVGATRHLQELLLNGSVAVLFQPIVELPGRRVMAYEALGRGRHPGLPESPAELFRAAAALGVEAELSRLFRRKVVEVVAGRSDFPSVFVNTHPAELAQPGFVESLLELPRGAPGTEFTVEVHEAAIVKVADMLELKTALSERGVRLAYDDFGAGQARLLELGEAPPDLLKFDLRFIRDVHKGPPSKRRLLQSLVGIVRDLGSEPLAEGVETAEEAEACAEIGFTRAQGYFFGRPESPPGS